MSCCRAVEQGCTAAVARVRNKTGDDKIDVVTWIPLINNFCVEFLSSSKSQRIFNEFISSSDIILLRAGGKRFVFVARRVLRSDLPAC